MPTVKIVQHFPLQNTAYSVLQLGCNLFIFKKLPLFPPLFVKFEQKLLHHIRLNSFVGAYEIFPSFLSLNCLFEVTYSLPEFEEGSWNVRSGWFWGKKRSFCCPCRNAFRFSQVVTPQWRWRVLTESALSQRCPARASLTALSLALRFLLPRAAPRDVGNQDMGLTRAEKGEDAGKAAELQIARQPFTQVLGFLFHCVSNSVQCCMLPSPLSTTDCVIPY